MTVSFTGGYPRNAEKEERGSLLKPGHLHIPWLKAKTNTTLRAINPVNPATGQECTVINKDVTSKYPEEHFGDAFCKVPCADVFIPGRSIAYRQCMAVHDTSKEGKAHGAFVSPLEWVIRKLTFNIDCARALVEKGYPSHIPYRWLSLRRVNKDYPGKYYPLFKYHLMMQGMACEINGEAVLNEAGSPTWKRVVLSVPYGMQNSLLGKLQLSSSAFGGATDLFSAQGGHCFNVEPVPGVDKLVYEISVGRHMPLTADQVNRLWVPWQDLLNIQYPEDQIAEMLDLFGPEIIGYCLGSHEVWGNPNTGWIDQSVLDAGRMWDHSQVRDPKDLYGLPEPGQPTSIPFPSPPANADLSLYRPQRDKGLNNTSTRQHPPFDASGFADAPGTKTAAFTPPETPASPGRMTVPAGAQGITPAPLSFAPMPGAPGGRPSTVVFTPPVDAVMEDIPEVGAPPAAVLPAETPAAPVSEAQQAVMELPDDISQAFREIPF